MFKRKWQEKCKDHPEIVGQEVLIMQAISNPFLGIYQDAKRKDREVYYKSGVESDDEITGRVVSMYGTTKAKQGETLIWTHSKA